MSLFAKHPAPTYGGRGMLLMLGGVVMGTAVGLLTAPQSGERTRRHLVRGVEDAKTQVAELYDGVTAKVDDLRRGAAETFSAGKDYIDKTTRALLGSPPEPRNPIRRLINTIRG